MITRVNTHLKSPVVSVWHLAFISDYTKGVMFGLCFAVFSGATTARDFPDAHRVYGSTTEGKKSWHGDFVNDLAAGLIAVAPGPDARIADLLAGPRSTRQGLATFVGRSSSDTTATAGPAAHSEPAALLAVLWRHPRRGASRCPGRSRIFARPSVRLVYRPHRRWAHPCCHPVGLARGRPVRRYIWHGIKIRVASSGGPPRGPVPPRAGNALPRNRTRWGARLEPIWELTSTERAIDFASLGRSMAERDGPRSTHSYVAEKAEFDSINWSEPSPLPGRPPCPDKRLGVAGDPRLCILAYVQGAQVLRIAHAADHSGAGTILLATRLRLLAKTPS